MARKRSAAQIAASKKNLEIARAARKSAGKSVARAAREYSAAMKGRIIKSSEKPDGHYSLTNQNKLKKKAAAQRVSAYKQAVKKSRKGR
ncbi:MAG: hypothetical protein KF682_18210 [Nitrospira sp.]|nr:hypothetical protein [Nitrospira sp.]